MRKFGCLLLNHATTTGRIGRQLGTHIGMNRSHIRLVSHNPTLTADEIARTINKMKKKHKAVPSSLSIHSKRSRKDFKDFSALENIGNRASHDFSVLGSIRKFRNPHLNLDPKPKQEHKQIDLKTFTVIGNRVTKDFIYCVKMVQGLQKYRRQHFSAPIIRGVTGVEWPHILNELKIRYGGLAKHASGPVVVLQNDHYLGGAKELKDLIEETYIYHMALNYPIESISIFSHFVKLTGRACAYIHIGVDDKPIGSLIFLLYSDICPRTCENFLRLCQTTKGGYSGTPIHRIVEDGWIQCGGFGLKDAPLGCENFIVPHDRRGVLGMCNADRGVDCSTQFFVLLQPALWMNYKYVAFGQLIDGEDTLNKIEEIPTFYESPAKNIIIYKAGLINLECDDIMVNRGAVAYIDQHIEDLVSIEEMFREWLWQLVETDIEAKALMAEVISRDSQSVNDGGGAPTGITAPQSGMKTNGELSQMSIEGEEHFPCGQTPTHSVIKEKRPYYIPLTDVPYPGERDSNFDLKRFLQGEYCLESDLDPQQPKEINKSRQERGKQLDAISGIMGSYSGALQVISDMNNSHSSLSSEDADLDEFEKKAIEDYLREYGDKVSFAGNIVKSIGKTYLKRNLLQYPQVSFADEEVRRIRLALQDLRMKANQKLKKVSIGVSPWDIHTQIKRRQTGFLPHAFDFAAAAAAAAAGAAGAGGAEDEHDEKDDDVEYNKSAAPRTVSILCDSKYSTSYKIQRQQTGFVENRDFDELSGTETIYAEDERPKDKKTTVRTSVEMSIRSSTTKTSRMLLQKDSRPETRPSVLVRLYEDVALDSDDGQPMLKDFKPKGHKKESILNMEDFKNDLRRDNHRFSDQDIVDTEGTAERVASSSVSYLGRKRPTLSVSAYKLKNMLYAEKIKIETEEKQKKTTEGPNRPAKTEKDSESEKNKQGLRLPGDTPLYTSEYALQMKVSPANIV